MIDYTFVHVMTINEVLYDKDHLTIYANPDLKLIHLKWKRFANSDQFREGMKVALDIVKEQGIELWLANLKLMEAISPPDEEWTINYWLPLLGDSSLQKLAIVTSLDYFNNTSVKRILNTPQPVMNFETRYFVDFADAKEWLLRDR